MPFDAGHMMDIMVKTELLPWQAVTAAQLAAMEKLRDEKPCFDNPFFDPNFADVMASVRDDVWVALAYDTQGLLGFWPFHRRPGNWARPIGAPFSDWHAPITRKGVPALSPTEFLASVGLKGMSAHGLQPDGVTQLGRVETEGSGIAYVPDGTGPYLDRQRALFPKHAKNLRRAERMIARDFADMTITLDDQSEDAFEWLMARKAEQFAKTGKHNVLGSVWAKQMLANVRIHKSPRLRGRLSTLRLNGEIAAAEFNLLSDKIVHGWITAYDTSKSGYSVGHLLLSAVICGMEQTGHEMYDLGAGDQAYKKYYESFQLPIVATTLLGASGGRPLGRAWVGLETIAPPKMAGALQSMRRRGDQIFGSELSLSGRAKGMVQALSRIGARR